MRKQGRNLGLPQVVGCRFCLFIRQEVLKVIRMEAKRRALDEIAARQRAADEKRKAEAERRQQAAVAQSSAAVQ